MYDQFTEQTQSLFKPLADLVSLNTKILQEAAERQKSFFTDIVNDNVAFTRELGAQKDFSGVYQVQKSYLEGIQEKMLNASTEAYEFVTSAQERAGEVVKSAGAR
jgi:phasin family protein